MKKPELTYKHLDICEYEPIWQAMREYTDQRGPEEPDQIWFLQHTPVFTQGQNGKAEHILNTGDIPVVQVDRGGQITYHGPGQLVAYVMIDLRRIKIGVRDLVCAIEKAVISCLADHGIQAQIRDGAPGVYVDQAKVASLGLRVRRGCSYHGLSFNINMDLEPFSRINPCGFSDLSITQVKDLGGPEDLNIIKTSLMDYLEHNIYKNCAE